jgi:polyvinyl alcohol dehydrogenase (cytochrome)
MRVPARMLIGTLCSGVLFGALIFPVISFSSARTATFPLAAAQETAALPDGATLYRQKCAMCHEQPVERAPSRSALAARSPETLIAALTSGAMKHQATGLSADQIRSVAVYLTGRQPGAAEQSTPSPNLCKDGGGSINLSAPQWNGWGFDLENSRYQPKPGIKAEDVPRLKVKWAFAYPSGRVNSQPTVIGDRLYVGCSPGLVYCLNAKTGCVYWTYDGGSGVRTAISVGPLPASSPAKFAAYFGTRDRFVHAVDAETGKPLWKTKIEDQAVSGITGAPVLYKDRIYVALSSSEEVTGRGDKYECCTFRGSLVALDAYRGKILWKSYSITEPLKPFKKSAAGTQMYGPAGGAIWSAPTVDAKRKLIYAATGDSYTEAATGGADAIIAFDIETGKVAWINQVTPNDNFLVGCNGPNPPPNCPQPLGPDFDFGSSPILHTQPNGKQVILAGQKSGVIYALDPDNKGKTLWQVKIGYGSTLGGIQWGSAADQQNVYAAVSDVTAPADKRLPGIAALKIATGERVWRTPAPKSDCVTEGRQCSNAQSAAVTAIPGVVFSGSMDGHFRAYSTKDGSIIWDFNSGANTFDAVNGIKARGGMMNAGGPVIVSGVLFVNAGYGGIQGQPGNVLLAFTVDGK